MTKTVLVTGSNGLCGSALLEEVNNGFSSDYNFYFSTRDDANLIDAKQTKELFNRIKPDMVIHTAAKVGGIGGHKFMHADYFYDNILMNTNIIRNCVDSNVQKLLAFSSVCAFSDCLSVLEEEKIHDGPVFEANFAYGYSKRMIDVYISAVKKQYGINNYCSVIPGNVFGKHDMFSIEYGHIVPSLIHKLYLAKKNNTDFNVWGDGKSLREFIYANDLAKVLLRLLQIPEIPQSIIVSGDKEFSIKDIVNFLVEISEFEGDIKWDTSKPNGQRSRPSSKKCFNSVIPDFEHSDIKESLKLTWDWFVDSYPKIRQKYSEVKN